jgi:hypothetical protein
MVSQTRLVLGCPAIRARVRQFGAIARMSFWSEWPSSAGMKARCYLHLRCANAQGLEGSEGLSWSWLPGPSKKWVPSLKHQTDKFQSITSKPPSYCANDEVLNLISARSKVASVVTAMRRAWLRCGQLRGQASARDPSTRIRHRSALLQVIWGVRMRGSWSSCRYAAQRQQGTDGLEGMPTLADLAYFIYDLDVSTLTALG